MFILAEVAEQVQKADGVSWTQMIIALGVVAGALATMFKFYDKSNSDRHAQSQKQHEEYENSRKDLIDRLDKKDLKIDEARSAAVKIITDSHVRMTEAYQARAEADKARATADLAQAESMRKIAEEFTETVRLTAKHSSGMQPQVNTNERI